MFKLSSFFTKKRKSHPAVENFRKLEPIDTQPMMDAFRKLDDARYEAKKELVTTDKISLQRLIFLLETWYQTINHQMSWIYSLKNHEDQIEKDIDLYVYFVETLITSLSHDSLRIDFEQEENRETSIELLKDWLLRTRKKILDNRSHKKTFLKMYQDREKERKESELKITWRGL